MTRTSIIAAFLLMLAAVLPAFGQQGQNPPNITDVRFMRGFLFGGTFVVIDPDFNPDNELASELDVILVEVDVEDADVPNTGQGNEGEEFFNAIVSEWIPYFPYLAPEPPPMPGTTGFSGGQPWYVAANWRMATIPPSPPGTNLPATVTIRIYLRVPEFQGVNQARLRGLINYDVEWLIDIYVANVEAPTEEEPFDRTSFLLRAVEDPSLRPPDPPPFSNAGADKTVLIGTPVDLDGSRTFDSSNLGFNPLDPEVYEKNNLTFTWEWLTGPLRVDPTYPDPTARPWLGRVTLPIPGVYEYRLLVDDGVNAMPSLDTLKINAVSQLPVNHAPRAVIIAPTQPVAIGSIVTLDGRSSSDPDGNTLFYRWHQTDEVGGSLPASEFGELFQPAGGLESSVASWQALRVGTYYFELIVSDGQLEDTASVSVEVVEAAAGGTGTPAPSGSSGGAPSSGTPPGATPPAPTLCGAGVLPLTLLPLLFWPLRRRTR